MPGTYIGIAMSGNSTSVVDSGTVPASSKVRRPWILRILIVAALLIIGIFLWRLFHPPSNPNRLFCSGRLEGYETNLSPKIGGRIAWIKYREGNAVKAGEQLAQLNDADYQAQLQGAEARIAKAQQAVKYQIDQLGVVQAQIYGAMKYFGQASAESTAQIDQARAGLREAQSRYGQAQADAAQARAELQLAEIRLGRYTDLVKKGAVTKDEYDQAVTTYKTDEASVKSRSDAEKAQERAVQVAQAAVETALATRYNPPIRKSNVDVYQVQLDQAHKQIKQAQEDLKNAIADRNQIQANIDYLKIISPITGVVTARPVEPGAVLAPGQTVLTVLDYSQVYMRAFIPEGDIARVRIGQKADVYLDALPKRPFSGKVIEIDPEGSFTPENIYFKNDRVKQVFGIKIGLDNPDGYAKPGMPADAYIEL